MNNKVKINHLAIIMDGNGRWGKQEGINLYDAYVKGIENAHCTVKNVQELQIPHLTLFAFSDDNWNRPQEEIDFLLELVGQYLDKAIDEIIRNNIKLSFMGNLNKIPHYTRQKMLKSQEATKHNTGLSLNIAFSYSGQDEIIDSVKQICDLGYKSSSINKCLIKKYMYNPGMPDVDLMIRTGGDIRISNFLLWYLGYAELYFINKYWPDFSKEDLNNAIKEFNSRKRNFGYARK